MSIAWQKVFFKLSQEKAVNGLFKKITVDDKEITSHPEVNNKIQFFKENIFKTKTEISSFLDELPIPKLKLQRQELEMLSINVF